MNVYKQEMDRGFVKLHKEGILTWYPWVGANYQPGGLMVIGESNYADSDEGKSPEEACEKVDMDVNFTREVVNKFCINHEEYNKTLDGISKVLSIDGFAADSYFVWQRIAYMDVIQKAMRGLPKKPVPERWVKYKGVGRERPGCERLWKWGWRAVLKVIDILKPGVLLLVGAGVGDHCASPFLQDGYESSLEKKQLDYCHSGSYRVGTLTMPNGNSIYVFIMHNPSSKAGFEPNVWRGLVKKHLREIGFVKGN